MNSYKFVNFIEIYKWKAKDSEIYEAPSCLGHVYNKNLVDNMENTVSSRYIYDFLVDYDSIDVANILDIPW